IQFHMVHAETPPETGGFGWRQDQGKRKETKNAEIIVSTAQLKEMLEQQKQEFKEEFGVDNELEYYCISKGQLEEIIAQVHTKYWPDINERNEILVTSERQLEDIFQQHRKTLMVELRKMRNAKLHRPCKPWWQKIFCR